MDGSGYPDGLNGSEILLQARIIAVADVVEAIAHHRPYRPANGLEKAVSELEKGRGLQYDPQISDVALRLLKEKKFRFEQ